MGKIFVLDEKISGRIAAGEVVERPASIVKELAENSIDAGATSIAIAISEGGIKSIRVSDNGGGISKEDMPLTIIKHATSKIRSLEDLDRIYTMGFRGEALASISAVSMMKIRSKTPESELGCELSVRGGKVEHLHEIGLPDGTVILVENLFYNTPARLKFLKKPATEAAAISAVVADLIISHPEISFQYTSNGAVIYHSPGNGSLLDAILSVEGMQLKPNLAEIDITFREISVKGYLSMPSVSFKRNSGRVFVNTRPIRSNVASNAVINAYGQRLLKGSFPYYVLHITMPAEDVDVNVHPNKLQVHFRDDNAISYVISEGVDIALQKGLYTPVVELPHTESISESPCAEMPPQPMRAPEKPVSSEEKEDIEKELSRVSEMLKGAAFAEQNTMELRQFSNVVEVRKEEPKKFEQPKIFTQIADYNIIGTAFNSFIIVEAEDTLYLIDQHAAHERLIYDELRNCALEDVPVQRFLISDIVHFSHEEARMIDDNIDLLRKIGIDIEPFGSLSYKIDAIPEVISGVNPSVLIRDIVDELSEGSRLGSTILMDKIAKAACKRAVKAGWKLPPSTVSMLVRSFIDTGTIPNCPHGRPIAIALTKQQLEKSFRRRV